MNNVGDNLTPVPITEDELLSMNVNPRDNEVSETEAPKCFSTKNLPRAIASRSSRTPTVKDQNGLLFNEVDHTSISNFDHSTTTAKSEQCKKPYVFDDYGFVTARTLLESEGSEILPLIEPLFPSVGIMAIVGVSDIGKSTLSRQLAFAVAYGDTHFIGYKINAIHHKAIYVTTEDDYGSIKRLLKIQYGIPEEIERTERLEFLFESDNLLNKIKNKISNEPVDLIIIDAFADIFTGQLNANNEVRGFLNSYRELALKHKCLIIFIHHNVKWSEYKEPSKNNSIGSQGFEAKMRLLIDFRKDPNNEDIRHLCIVKGNYLPAEQKSKSIALLFNDRMLFENLNYGIPFEQLKIDPKNKHSITANPAKDRAIQLKISDTELSVREITEKLNAEGFDRGKSTVGEWIKQMD